MDFRLQKLRLALWILAVGMVVSLLYHGWQGWVFGNGYPYNTFLCFPQGRYDDFTNLYRFALSGDPYSYPLRGANYFPAAFLIFDSFGWLPPIPAAILFLNLCVVCLFVLLNAVLRPLLPHPGRCLLACNLLLWTYPLLFDLDRGNNEILLVLLVGTSLFFFSQKRFILSFLFLLPAICFKLYPGILLLLFFRQRLFHWFFAGILGFALISWTVLLTFPGTVYENYQLFLHALYLYNQDIVLGHSGVAASASPWNLVRIVIWVFHSFYDVAPPYVGQLSLEINEFALTIYNAIAFLSFIFLTLDVLLIETRFPRRALILLLFMTSAAPGGGDYKMMYVGVALVILVLIRERRPFDLILIGLLAFCLLPKREVFLHFMGRSDTGEFDASLAVIANPLCMLTAIGLLVVDGWKAARPFRLNQIFHRLLGPFRFLGLRSMGRKFLDLSRTKNPRPV